MGISLHGTRLAGISLLLDRHSQFSVFLHRHHNPRVMEKAAPLFGLVVVWYG